MFNLIAACKDRIVSSIDNFTFRLIFSGAGRPAKKL